MRPGFGWRWSWPPIVGLPFFVLATASPTTQRWFAAVPGTSEPYRLFAASNAGSLIGLIAYPTLVEPNLDLPDQARWWSIGFAVFAAGTVALALIVRRSGHLSRDDVAATEPRPVARRRAMWVLLAAVPAALLIGVTTDISTDIAAVPFLWVVPLTIYLATLILAYLRPEPIGRRLGSVVLPVLALAVALRAIGAIDLSLWQSIGLLLATLAAAGLALHGRLAADRPSPVYLTSYSLHVALGGALGGVLTGIVAPLVFRVPVEGLLVIAAAVVMVAGSGWLRLASIPPLVAVLVAVAWSLIGSPDTIRARPQLLWRLPRRRAAARPPRPRLGHDDPRPRDVRRTAGRRAAQLLPPGRATRRSHRVDAGGATGDAVRRGRARGWRDRRVRPTD